MNCINIPDDSLENWLSLLKPYQRNTLKQFMAEQDALQAAEIWLTTIGNPNIAGFGGDNKSNTKPYWNKFKAERKKFICDESDYSEDR